METLTQDFPASAPKSTAMGLDPLSPLSSDGTALQRSAVVGAHSWWSLRVAALKAHKRFYGHSRYQLDREFGRRARRSSRPWATRRRYTPSVPPQLAAPFILPLPPHFLQGAG